jgi:hypothetical protein
MCAVPVAFTSVLCHFFGFCLLFLGIVIITAVALLVNITFREL